jgi:hypothetical protein
LKNAAYFFLAAFFLEEPFLAAFFEPFLADFLELDFLEPFFAAFFAVAICLNFNG